MISEKQIGPTALFPGKIIGTTFQPTSGVLIVHQALKALIGLNMSEKKSQIVIPPHKKTWPWYTNNGRSAPRGSASATAQKHRKEVKSFSSVLSEVQVAHSMRSGPRRVWKKQDNKIAERKSKPVVLS